MWVENNQSITNLNAKADFCPHQEEWTGVHTVGETVLKLATSVPIKATND